MKHWTPVVFLAFLWALALAAYSNSEMQTLVKNLGKGYIRLSDANYKKHLFGHRDYHVVLYMTSQAPQINCVLCREFTPTFETIAHLYSQTFPEGVSTGKDVYFLYAEFMEGKKLFELMGLDLIPKMFHFPPNKDTVNDETFDKESEQFQFYQGDFLELTRQWVAQISGHAIQIYTPPDYSKMIFNAVVTFSLILLFKRFRSQVFLFFKSNFLWGAITIVLVLLFTAGHMFTQIRSVPFINERPEGTEVFATNSQMQYGVETQVISTLYGLMGITFIVLANRISSIKNAKVQFLAVTIISALLYLLYSIFLSIFSIKYRGYPYMLFSFFNLQ